MATVTGYQVYYRRKGDSRTHRKSYFNLNTMLKQMKDMARVLGIKIARDGRYGKMDFMNQNPESGIRITLN